MASKRAQRCDIVSIVIAANTTLEFRYQVRSLSASSRKVGTAKEEKDTNTER